VPAARAWIDTSALLALASPRDQHHARAVQILNAHQRAGIRWASSVLVLDEFHRAILYRGGPAPARSAIIALLNDPAIEWLDVSAALAAEATTAWLERHADQDYSLTDAVSFELMTRERIAEAFAFDRHYLVAGFRLLR
jgi:predicted nucleic acid-binding protein